MAEPFLAEIRMMSFNFAPKGWAMCNGQQMPINQNQALFSLLGTTYGGNGQTNFNLPDSRGRIPIHFGNGHSLGERAGESEHTITAAETPQHNHIVGAVSTGTTSGNLVSPTNNLLVTSTPNNLYTSSLSSTVVLNAGTVTTVGGSQAHDNMQPYSVINFCIALQGIFPSQT